MINPRELRIGNIIHCITNKMDVVVQYPHPAKVVVDVMWPDGGGCDFVDGDLEEFEPILLTKERMYQYGFTWARNIHRWVHSCGYMVIEDDYGFKIGYGDGSFHAPPIKHVHQLQNLYYTMVGEELMLNVTTNE